MDDVYLEQNCTFQVSMSKNQRSYVVIVASHIDYNLI
jgi:hypothetical protein